MRTIPADAKIDFNKADFRKKYLLKLLASPICLFPFLAGVTDLLVLWTFSIGSGIALFAGIAGMLAGLGIFFTRLVAGSGSLVKDVLAGIQQEALAEREKALDNLDNRLVADGDPRTESSLRDLRTLAAAFEKGRSWTGALKTSSTVDILSGVNQLFQQCVVSLEKTLELGYTAAQMTTKTAREPILKERERIITEVSESIRQLGGVLASIQALETDGTAHDSELADIRRELDQNLEVAKKVKERMESLEKEFE